MSEEKGKHPKKENRMEAAKRRRDGRQKCSLLSDSKERDRYTNCSAIIQLKQQEGQFHTGCKEDEL